MISGADDPGRRPHLSREMEENMKFYYPCIVHKNEDGTYHAYFPDLAMCEADGDSMDDVLWEANQAAYNWIESELLEEEPELPPVSDREDIILEDGDEFRMILVNMRLQPGWEE